mmetsp:Transcript_19210/g.43761  ORF Transcript_19210/g.43761 Transcript_19210/m.43761 type:complete len:283 (+) Transcript_19210:600-1448(+)
MRVGRPGVSFGAGDAEHARLVQHETKFIARVGHHPQFRQLGLQPPPAGLRPHDHVVLSIRPRQKLVHVRPLERLGRILRPGGTLQHPPAEVQKGVVQVEHKQGKPRPRRVHDVHRRGGRELNQVLSDRHVLVPLVRPGRKVAVEIVRHLGKAVPLPGIYKDVRLHGSHQDELQRPVRASDPRFAPQLRQPGGVGKGAAQAGAEREADQLLALGEDPRRLRQAALEAGDVHRRVQVGEGDAPPAPFGDHGYSRGYDGRRRGFRHFFAGLCGMSGVSSTRILAV